MITTSRPTTSASRCTGKPGPLSPPGDCFEQPHSMRIGYACDKQTLQDGLAALAAFADTL